MAIKAVNNERELLEKVSKGNEDAFAELFYAYHNQLGEYVFLLTDSDQITEEIVQDVFVKIWTNREMLPTIEKFTAYLFILTKNYTLNCIRQSVKERKLQNEYGQMQIVEHDSDELLLANDPEYQSLIEKAISQLPPQQQKVFILRQQGMKNPEIARNMDISTNSVKKYQQWALKTVTDFVKAHVAFAFLLIFSK